MVLGVWGVWVAADLIIAQLLPSQSNVSMVRVFVNGSTSRPPCYSANIISPITRTYGTYNHSYPNFTPNL